MKKFLLSILISFIGLVGFGYCGTIEAVVPSVFAPANGTYYADGVILRYKLGSPSANYNGTINVCVEGFTSYDGYEFIGFNNATSKFAFCQLTGSNYCCDIVNGTIYSTNTYYVGIGYISQTSVSRNNYLLPDPFKIKITADFIEGGNGGGSCTNYTSEECQHEYSLMPISSCDSEYCQLNELCGTGSSGSGDLQWSSLFINGIQHVGGSIIDVTIPSEIQRNYIYTGENEETFKLDIEGLNGDPDYIQGIIDVNSYRPTSEDFTNTFVGGLTLIFPYIIITAFIVFIWRFIRKIFK